MNREDMAWPEEDLAYARRVLNPWERLGLAIWRWRTGKAFDARDKHEYGTWKWQKVNDKLERRFS